MGRSASHIALECALQVQPNICIVSEEVEAKNMSLDDVVTYIAQAVANRAAKLLTQLISIIRKRKQ
jgi:pyrophosphate--fructose-6-phosphate 1-phosphotransferase